MTDEEMAEEYIHNGTVFVHNKVTIESIKQAFLAGLNTGKDMKIPAKWHDLRKDPK